MTQGDEHLVKLVDLALTMANIVVQAEKDGHIGLEDLGLLAELVPVVGPAIDGIGQVPAELAALSADDAMALAAHVMATLALTDEKAKAVVDAALKAAIADWALIKALKA